jgi:hypothetical protein
VAAAGKTGSARIGGKGGAGWNDAVFGSDVEIPVKLHWDYCHLSFSLINRGSCNEVIF